MPTDGTAPTKRNVCTQRLSHVAFRVVNLEEAIRFLNTKDVHWLSEIIDADAGGKIRSFLDPTGNMLQIVELPSTFFNN